MSAVTSAVTNTMRRTLGFAQKEDTFEEDIVHPMYGIRPIDPPGDDEKATGTARPSNTHTLSGTRYYPPSTDYVDDKQSADGRIIHL